ncbi:MAG: hypothetical protein LBH05_04095, partial [Deferribacteraceae bacterium]|nr:hypothetical protein [Deferribacteraceae bacterium]
MLINNKTQISIAMQRLFVFTAFLTLFLSLNIMSARADDEYRIQSNISANATLSGPKPSYYDYSSFARGQPFFLLSDASFGSSQVAQVRLEAPGREFQQELQSYGGADIVVYRIPNPLPFLKAQKNLRRLDIKPNYKGEGLTNTLRYLWDRWFSTSRRAWQRVFSFSARNEVTKAKPEFKLGEQVGASTKFEPASHFAPLPGYDLVSRFRYPIWDAKTIQPPQGVNLEGSSSNFIKDSPGNVMIPVGALQPGLYLVEAVIGNYRAH